MRAWLATGAMAVLLALPGCRTDHDRQEKRMADLEQALLRLSSAVEGVVRYGDLAPTAGEQEILAAVADHDRGLVAPFEGYAVHVQRQGKHAVVLVCDRADRTGLLEDAGCTAPLDRKLWAMSAPAPCRFGLDVDSVCAGGVRADRAP